MNTIIIVMTTKEIAVALNEIIRLESSDQAKLLEVIEDYFCPPHVESEDEEEMDIFPTSPTKVDEGV